MKRITDQPLVRYLGGDLWRLEEQFTYHVGSDDSTDVIVIPVGFETDFASIPKFLQGWYPKAGPYLPAAIVHDYLCVTKTRSSQAAAAIFLEAMEVLKIPRLRRYAFFYAVLWFGPQFEAQPLAELSERLERRRQELDPQPRPRKVLRYGKHW